MLFFAETLIALSANAFYFFRETKNGIAEIEKYTRGYSVSLAEAFAEIAATGYASRNYNPLKTLFSEKISNNMINEAFFAFTNGDLKAHTSKEKAGEVKGNIANDEFAYNLDMIMKPVLEKSTETIFSDYNMMDREVPFSRDEKRFMKEHLYSGIDSSGWLVSRAVYFKKKPVGTVNFLISKDRIFSLINKNIDDGKKYSLVAVGIAYAVSLAVSIIVFIRHRRIENRALASGLSDDLIIRRDAPLEEESIAILDGDSDLIPLEDAGAIVPRIQPDLGDNRKPISIELLAELEPAGGNRNKPAYSDTLYREPPAEIKPRLKPGHASLAGRIIKDPIPVSAREGSYDSH
jgi:hypothetical protein